MTIAIVYLAYETGGQTDQLIKAANTQAGAATKFATSADSINQQMKDAVDQFKQVSNAQLQAMTRQLSDFENAQVANLTIEELGAPDWEQNGLVSYKLFNRGNSLARNITYYSTEETDVVRTGHTEPDWAEVKRKMKGRFIPDPRGETLAPGQSKSYSFGIDREVPLGGV